MAVIDTVTIGADTFSVYALTLTNANTETDSFWNGRLGAERTAWEAASEDDQNRAMVAAADWIDRASNFTGDKTVDTQPRAWPRDAAQNGCTGLAITDGTTPDDIFYTQAWLSGIILADTAAAASPGQGSNVKKLAAGSAEIQFFRSTSGTSKDTRLPTVANDYIKCYTGAGSQANSGAIASGTDACSEFDSDDVYDLRFGAGFP